MKKGSKIFVAGNTGLVGSAIVKKLRSLGYNNLVFRPFPEYDLRNQKQTEEFFEQLKPEYVFLAAAKVGGIKANNDYPAEFIYDNTMIEFNSVHAAYKNNVKKLLFLGSSCIYPKYANQPIREEELLTGSLEPTNEPYAIAKISGLKMCGYYRRQYGCDFISAMPTNLYGPNDNFNLDTSHVLPAIIRKMYLAKCLEDQDFDAIRNDLQVHPFSLERNYNHSWLNQELKDILNIYGIKYHTKIKTDEKNENLGHHKFKSRVSVELWGSGSPCREFLHVDDLTNALIFLMNNYSDYGHVNIGYGKDITIKNLAKMIQDIVGFSGEVKWDTSRPDGTPKKLLDVSKLKELGWEARVSLRRGIENVYRDYLEK